ncbi:MAG: nucleotide pyrophosphatase [Dehalococcoidia bacterium]
MLSREINYIVSGLERSGTSVMMQMLHNGGLPVAFDESRPADEHNPKGYFELAGGKIINQLIDGTFDMGAHRGLFVKVTAYGLKFLPEGSYRVVYMMRNIEEVLDSMYKMGGEMDREKDRDLFTRLDRFSLKLLDDRDDIKYITINYRDVINNPRFVIEKIGNFLGEQIDFEGAVEAVDDKLYRNRVAE